MPSGAGGLPEVKPLLLAEMPAPPEKVQGEPVGRYWNWPAPTCTCSKPASPIAELLAERRRLIDEGGVVAAGAVQALERDRVRPGGDGERGGGSKSGTTCPRGEGADHDAVDQHLEVLLGRLVVAALGGVEGEHVGAGGPAGDGLAERAGPLEEGDLCALGAAGLPEVKPLLLPEMPEPPEKVQGEPVGRYWNWPAPTCTCSNPASATLCTWSRLIRENVSGAAPAAVAVTGYGPPGMPLAVAVTDAAPEVIVAGPDGLSVAEAPLVGVVKDTTPPSTGSPGLFGVIVTCNAFGNAVLMAVDWLLPEATAIVKPEDSNAPMSTAAADDPRQAALVGGQWVSLGVDGQRGAAGVDGRATGEQWHGLGRPAVVAQGCQQRVDAHEVAVDAVDQPAGIRRVVDEVVVAADRPGDRTSAGAVGHDGVAQ